MMKRHLASIICRLIPAKGWRRKIKSLGEGDLFSHSPAVHKGILSYSQFGEDRIAEELMFLLLGIRRPFCHIEIGSNHPIELDKWKRG
jgi:hypothetical protein